MKANCKLFYSVYSDVPSNTLSLIPNEFGTVFELDVQRLETLEGLEIQYSQALSKPERQTISHNRFIWEALTFKATLLFVYRCSPLYRNINSTTILVYRTMAHMWKWFHGLVFLILMKANKADWRLTRPYEDRTSQSQNCNIGKLNWVYYNLVPRAC